MSGLEAFGATAATAMMACYALERRGSGFVLGFAAACAAASLYAVAIAAWPFAGVEAVWALVALRRWSDRRRA